MPSQQSKQALRQHRRDNGLCIHCGETATNGTRCQKCTDRDNENRKRRQLAKRAVGGCLTDGCKKKARKGKAYCQRCADKMNGYERARFTRGVCGKCKQPAEPGKQYCSKHLSDRAAYMRKFQQKRVDEGRCTHCGDLKLEGTKRHCETCLQRQIDWRLKRKIKVMDHYGGPCCVGCGESDARILQMDHTNGGGNQHAKEIGGRGKIYQWLIANNFPPGFRVLCPNCNIRAWRGIPFPNST